MALKASLTFAAFLPLLSTSIAQTVITEQILSTFIYTRYGDKTPFVLPSDSALTPLGAQQLYEAGSLFRQRYVAPIPTTNSSTGVTTIRNISPYQLFYDEMTVLSTTDQYVFASAQAFMQGLYPPLLNSSGYTFITGQSGLANGSNVVAPLGGYNYPNIQAASSNDLSSIWVEGMNNCPAYAASSAEYLKGPDYQNNLQSTLSFYQSLGPEFLSPYFANSSMGYFDAFYIWDYLDFANTHNGTVAKNLAPEDLTRAKILAADWLFALNANTSASGLSSGDHIRAISGRTLATRILSAFYNTINTQGTTDKMTLLFGSFEPMIAFAGLAQLISPQNAAFYNVPAPGSSFVFELVSLQANKSAGYPTTNDIYVRFLYQNETGADSSLVAYPLFGESPSSLMMPFSDFIAGLQKFMIFDIEDWCDTCNSFSVFCPAFKNSGILNSGASSNHGLQPAVAGAIGAVVTLAVIGLVAAALMVLGGFRLHRNHTKRRSELGGFKGAEKLASDQDLTIPKGGAGAVVTETVASPVRGHERVGSWELGDQAKADEIQPSGLIINRPLARRPSYEDDDLSVYPGAAPVKPHDHV